MIVQSCQQSLLQPCSCHCFNCRCAFCKMLSTWYLNDSSIVSYSVKLHPVLRLSCLSIPDICHVSLCCYSRNTPPNIPCHSRHTLRYLSLCCYSRNNRPHIHCRDWCLAGIAFFFLSKTGVPWFFFLSPALSLLFIFIIMATNERPGHLGFSEKIIGTGGWQWGVSWVYQGIWVP